MECRRNRCALCCQLVSVYVNNWCGADGEPVDGSPTDYNTLPHYQRYQRCLGLQHQQQACLGHHHAGQRAHVIYETVGRTRDGVDGVARATLCSRHGRSNSLSPGKARYAAGQLCSAARLRRPLMPPADSDGAPAADVVVAAVTTAVEERATTSSRPGDAEQSARSIVDDPSADAAPATDSTEVVDVAAAEMDNVDSRTGETEVPDNADADTKDQEQPADAEQPSDAVDDSHDLLTDGERCTEQNRNDDNVVEAKTEPEVQNIEENSVNGTVNQEEASAAEDSQCDLTTDVVDGDLFAGRLAEGGQLERVEELTSKDEDGDWSSRSPVIRLDQTSAKFDSSALEKILSSLSATSRRDLDGRTTVDNDAEDVDDEVWMRRDVVANCRSSLSMLDAAAAQLDSGLHFKSRRRRSSCSSSSSSSVGHCSPSCLIPTSTLDTETETSTTLLLSCATEVETSVDAPSTLANTTSIIQPSTSSSVEPAKMDESLPTNGKHYCRLVYSEFR